MTDIFAITSAQSHFRATNYIAELKEGGSVPSQKGCSRFFPECNIYLNHAEKKCFLSLGQKEA